MSGTNWGEPGFLGAGEYPGDYEEDSAMGKKATEMTCERCGQQQQPGTRRGRCGQCGRRCCCRCCNTTNAWYRGRRRQRTICHDCQQQAEETNAPTRGESEMASYVIRKTDQGGGWVTPPGEHSSYTHKLQEARLFATRAEAERECCPGNEVVVPVEYELRRAR